ncbi:MAG: sulfate adenylyltransferase [Alphaproteobacteria bacterium]|nr:MAG: sulfate adenylyltransferase [Alphaproteobacteria bacterium]
MTMTPLKTIKFLTCGHVDDGKSTLIGRLLYDIDVVPDDHIEAAKNDDGVIDYSLFTDGLEDERRQGITIDVAYRFFRYEGCRYQIADTPGHLEYMRNMAVAAITSDVAVILVDGIHGVRLQTVQYSKIAKFFGVRHFVLAVNKMDAVAYDQAQFERIVADYKQAFLDDDIACLVDAIPVSAICGDNVVHPSPNTPWYHGKTLMDYLRDTTPRAHHTHPLRLPIQHVVKDDAGIRWYLGTLHGDALNVGDKVISVESGQRATVAGIVVSGQKVQNAYDAQAVAVHIAEDVDISRGSVLASATHTAPCSDGFYADILWLEKKYEDRDSFSGTIKLHHHEEQVQVTIEGIKSPLKTAFVYLSHPIAMDHYEACPHTGLFILMDAYNERVVGVGTITSIVNYEYPSAEAI